MATIEDLRKNKPELEPYAIVRDGIVRHLVSPTLIKNQKVRRNLGAIKQLHHDREDVYDLMRVMDPVEDRESLMECDKELTDIEFKLQGLWKFTKDKKFHIFWYRPHCTCPIMDNNDRYPTGYYIISGNYYNWLGINEEKDVQKSKTKVNWECIDWLLLSILIIGYSILVYSLIWRP